MPLRASAYRLTVLLPGLVLGIIPGLLGVAMQRPLLVMWSTLMLLPAMWQVGIFAGATRKGAWQVPSRINALAMFGGVTLDLTEALWSSDTIEVNVGALFGGVDIIVPDDVEVRDSAVALFGSVDVSSRAAVGRRLLIVRGLAGFGGVSVKGPKVKRG